MYLIVSISRLEWRKRGANKTAYKNFLENDDPNAGPSTRLTVEGRNDGIESESNESWG